MERKRPERIENPRKTGTGKAATLPAGGTLPEKPAPRGPVALPGETIPRVTGAILRFQLQALEPITLPRWPGSTIRSRMGHGTGVPGDDLHDVSLGLPELPGP